MPAWWKECTGIPSINICVLSKKKVVTYGVVIYLPNFFVFDTILVSIYVHIYYALESASI